MQQMKEIKTQIKDKDGKYIPVSIQRDGRLKKTVRWQWLEDEELVVTE